MLDKYFDKPVQEDIIWAYSMMEQKRVLGSQRALQFAGKPIFKHAARIFNCCGSQIDRVRFFQECMYLLLCGCGTGLSVQKHHIAKLPNLIDKKQGRKQFIIEDSIEGWSDAVGVLVGSYFDDPLWADYIGADIEFDFSQIRPEGSYLSSSSGKAPGPAKLKHALEKIDQLLSASLKTGYLRPINAYDIVMHSANAVVSGGVRRSATICLFSPDDEDMINAKTGDWFYTNPQRGRSNNSVILLKDDLKLKEFRSILERTRQFGEPGFILSSNAELLINPCAEIGFWCYSIEDTEKYNKFNQNPWTHIYEQPEEIGLASGWQMCNLSTINGKKVKSKDDFLESCKATAIIGTLQAGFNTFPYLGDITSKIVQREALLGVSITGMMESPDILLNADIQSEGAEIVKKINKEIAAKININQAARTTCVKPEGTSSCVLGTSSGIHPHHAKRYIRRVQCNRLDNVYQYFRKFNAIACEKSVWSETDSDDVISFCIEVPDGSKTKNQLNALELLEKVKITQSNWVMKGRNKVLCTQPWLAHNVSNTISVKPEEWDDVAKYIFENRKYFCGISLINITGDKDYQQAPFTTIYLPSEITKYYGNGSVFVSGLIEKGLELFEDNLWLACDNVLGIKSVEGKAKLKWVERCKAFANKYMDGDIKKLTYCMKDVYNWKLWLDLNREYKNVNYEELIEESDFTRPENEIACAGGACLV
jgi:ribonucleoside-diphosphate reductase alpha chain